MSDIEFEDERCSVELSIGDWASTVAALILVQTLTSENPELHESYTRAIRAIDGGVLAHNKFMTENGGRDDDREAGS